MENADYLLHKFVEQVPSGAKHKTGYYVSVGMAKELAMVENNEKGKHALMIGLRTALRSTSLWKIKTLLSSTKNGAFKNRSDGYRMGANVKEFV